MISDAYSEFVERLEAGLTISTSRIAQEYGISQRKAQRWLATIKAENFDLKNTPLGWRKA